MRSRPRAPRLGTPHGEKNPCGKGQLLGFQPHVFRTRGNDLTGPLHALARIELRVEGGQVFWSLDPCYSFAIVYLLEIFRAVLRLVGFCT